ncbi:hypothetical protein [Halobacillus litoralis]|uniref:Uncharacterized protein n=1 Tax=Halobacillus litoralis TaxID=45668 RepID=A0A410MA56_9BACI|nr:hypothetical protein [Halobacillus litoralis]QAS51546.1 hypothetical protein HLI_04565 [Halobacillus litoralis]
MLPRGAVGGDACGNSASRRSTWSSDLLTKLAEAVSAASIHRHVIREKQQQTLTAPQDGKGFFQQLQKGGHFFSLLLNDEIFI